MSFTKNLLISSFVLVISSCNGPLGDLVNNPGGDATTGTEETIVDGSSIPIPTSLPTVLSVLGEELTLSLDGMDAQFSYGISFSTNSDLATFRDGIVAYKLVEQNSAQGTITVNMSILSPTLDANGDATLYMRVQAGDAQGFMSEYSEPVAIKVLGAPTEFASISATGRMTTIEWPVTTGQGYNVYYHTSTIYPHTISSATKVEGGPFTSGSHTFNPTLCTANLCYFAISKVEGSSESQSLSFTSGLRLSDSAGSFSFNKTEGDSVTLRRGNLAGHNQFRYYVSNSANPTPDTATLIHDSASDGGQIDFVHTISSYYDGAGNPLVYYYLLETYSAYDYTDASGTTKKFYSATNNYDIRPYTPSLSDFALKYGTSTYVAHLEPQKVGNSIFWLNKSAGTVYEYPLDGSAVVAYPVGGGTGVVAYAVDSLDKATQYSGAGYNVYKYSHDATTGSTTSTGTLTLGTTSAYSIFDMAQSDSDLFVLTRGTIIKVAKANVFSGGGFTELVTGLVGATDLELDATNGILYAADTNGIISVSVAGGSTTVESAVPATQIALNANGTKLYAWQKGMDQPIREILLSTGTETDIKLHVSVENTTSKKGVLEVIGDWLYFVSEAGTYRMSLLDSSVEQIAGERGRGIVWDATANEFYLVGTAYGKIFQLPEAYFKAPPIAPASVGVVSTLAKDTQVQLTIDKPVGEIIEFYMVNGQAVYAGAGASLTTSVSGLTNSQLASINVAAYNLTGGTLPISVQDTPVVAAPGVGVNGGNVSSALDLNIAWINPMSRDITLRIYRSTTPTVDTAGVPIATFPFTVAGSDPEAVNYSASTAYTDSTGLTDGVLYYYAATLDDGTGIVSADSAIKGTVPFAPYTQFTTTGARKGNTVARLGTSLYWADGTGLKGFDGAIITTVQDTSLAAMGTGTLEVVADDVDNALYVVKSGSSSIHKIAVDMTVDWIETTFATPGVLLDKITKDGTSLYAAGSGRVFEVSLLDGTVTTLYTSASTISCIMQGGAYVYWTEGASLKRVLKTGGTAETLLTETQNIGDLEVDGAGSNLFYSIPVNGSHTIKKYTISSSTTTIVTEQSNAPGFALNSAGDVYALLNRAPSTGVDYKEFVKFAAADGAETSVKLGWHSGSYDLQDMFLDGTNLYTTSHNYWMHQVQ
ncbi:MAG: hypothetical protein OEZ43_05805 [Gammaproteobacteria bacterium]|nr:hypothetical protein [Gammaproteobacteria bacterium]